MTRLDEYARAGIPEYWLLEPETRTVRIYSLAGEKYHLAATVTAGQIARSAAIAGFEAAVDAVFAA